MIGDFDKRATSPGSEAAVGIKVKVTYSNKDIAYTKVKPKDVYTIIKTATTDDNGYFSVDVDTKDASVKYTVTIDDYVTNAPDDVDNFTYLYKAKTLEVKDLVNGSEAFVELNYGNGTIVQGQN